jgi:serine/threonine-protein phosphatase PGAM5
MPNKASKTPPLHFVHMIRHGQYVQSPPEGDGPLTVLGRRQAAAAARYLARWPIARMWSSDLQRAIETAKILLPRLDVKGFRKTEVLREVVPSPIPGISVPASVRRQGRAAVEEVVAKFLVPLPAPRHDLLVCHGNLIRAVVCRVLDTDQSSWVKLATYHCALTSFAIKSDGSIALVRYGESAYLLSEQLLTDH